MPEPKLISPLLDGFVIGEPMSDHHGVCCCPAIREDTGERYIVKIISIPASQVQLDALLLTGAFSSRSQALSYFQELTKGVLAEAETLAQLTKLEGFLPYTNSQLVEMSEGIGYEIYLLSPYKRSLRKHMNLAPLTHLGAVNLGLDLCAALAASRRAGYLYVDLKPSNVFLTQTQGWRIGDLGFMPLSSLKYASLPDKYRSEYTAPEIVDEMSELNDKIDIYALGLVLYQVYNNGQLPFEGNVPEYPLPPPMYADYELAEIILRACDPDPGKRWADPAQMGQAIVDYMQRNSINDTPIVPPPVELPPESEDEPEDDFLNESENEAALADLMQSLLDEEPPDEPENDSTTPADEDLSFMVDPAVDETIPSDESAAELEDVEVTQEVEQMLAQADDLISHELPEPVVAPEPIDIPFPAPIILDADGNQPTSVPEVIDSDAQEQEVDTDEGYDEAAPSEDDEAALSTDPEVSQEATVDPQASTAEDTEASAETPIHERERKKRKSKINFKILISIAAVLIFMVAAGFGVSFYYQRYYLQSIDDITIDGDVNSLTVQISSDIDDALLKVICTDTYGNTRSSDVYGGVAQFTDLTPNTQYNIQVKISGTHRLVGTTKRSFSTAAQTEIISFNAVTGSEDGSAKLSFTVNGPEPDEWIVTFRSENEDEHSQTFSGHTTTINGLTVGSTYHFTLTANEKYYLTGTYELDYTARNILYAQNLHLTACGDGSINVAWSMPEEITEQNWIVRCYGDSGFDETITSNETAAQFTVPTHECDYTIEVTAEGMTTSSSITVSANPITITEVNEEVSEDGTLAISWSFTGNEPASGWIVSYSIDETAAISINCESSNAQLPYYPGSHYDVDIYPAEEVTVLGETYSYDASEAETFNQYRVNAAEDLSFYMCLTPDKEDWDRFDVPADDYKKKFTAGEKASFLVEVWSDYKKSDDEISISYIIRDENGAPISLDTEATTWNNMWEKNFCELDIPRLPSVVGKYTIEIYFNGYHVVTKKFTII